MDNHLRTDMHRRTKVLEELLDRVNCLFEEAELREISQMTQPKLPVLLIVGNPRSGTTLLYQWLAATGLFAYPSNIMSRFYRAPYIGGLLHKILEKSNLTATSGSTLYISEKYFTQGAPA